MDKAPNMEWWDLVDKVDKKAAGVGCLEGRFLRTLKIL